jgi:tight adherence protein B
MTGARPARVLRLVLAGLLSALVLAGPAIALAADDEEPAGPYLAIRGVDATGGDVVRLTLAYEGDGADLTNAVVTDNGTERDIVGDVVPLDTTGGQQAVVIAVDTSEAIDPIMADLRDAATSVVEGLPDDIPVGVVTFSDRFVPNRAITSDRARVLESIDRLQASGESVLWSGIAGAAGTIGDFAGDTIQPTVVVVTASGSFASTSTSGTAVGALQNAGAPLYVVGLDGERFDAPGLTDVVDRAGGRMLTTTDSEQLDEIGSTVATDIGNQFILAYDPPTGDEAGAVADVSVKAGDSTTAATFVRGSATMSPADLFPQTPSTPADGLLQTDLAKYLGVVLILAAAGLGAFALITLTQEDDSHLTNVLQPYSEGFIDTPIEEEDSGMAKTALIQRAVEMTEEFAERKGFLRAVEEKLERADLPLRAAEALFFYAAMVAVVSLLALVMTRSLIGTLVFTGIAALFPSAFVNFKAKRRLKKFNAQLPDMLQLLAGTLRAGYSLMQGVEAVSREVEDPIGYELRRVVTESRLGRPLEESLEAAAERMGSADFGWAVMAIGIQREVGGNLAELLMTVSDTMVARERLRRDVDALTAEGKVSAMVLGLLPLGLAGAMFVINPEYIGVLFSSTIGHMMIGGSTLLAGFGFWWMKKLVEIDV